MPHHMVSPVISQCPGTLTPGMGRVAVTRQDMGHPVLSSSSSHLLSLNTVSRVIITRRVASKIKCHPVKLMTSTSRSPSIRHILLNPDSLL
jgi:hypothetical protein